MSFQSVSHNKKEWIHIEFYFFRNPSEHRNSYYLNPKQLKKFREYISLIIKKYKNHIFRKFYLFEQYPHCFLALEIKTLNMWRFYKIKEQLKPPSFISAIKTKSSNDEDNKEAFLNFQNSACEMILSKEIKHPPWLKEFPKHERMIMHNLHCFMNSYTNSRPQELRIYRDMYLQYGQGLVTNIDKWGLWLEIRLTKIKKWIIRLITHKLST